MISKILIIKASGILCYSKTLREEVKIDDDFISGFLTTVLDISKKIGGGEIRSLNSKNFNINYSYDNDKLCIFILIADIYDPEEELNDILRLLKAGFMQRFREDITNWDGDIARFERFDSFVEEEIYLLPKILFIGEEGVGKTTILNLFPGELFIELDDDMNEIIQKNLKLGKFKRIKKCTLRELDIEEVVNNPKGYNQVLESANVICFITNSGASNLNRTKNYVSLIEQKAKRAKFYVIANFQDLSDVSFQPEKIEELFGFKTYGLSAISGNATIEIYSYITEMLKSIKIE